MEQEKKLQVRNLRISFRTSAGKVQAVRGISFNLHKGETLAIVGESGSGKSVKSKAILGIQAGNAITEGGEILYDGQDLLKIPEEDFYRLRGDKIAMIFQDPLSSLNPIMRIGKQLTEAMLLKGKARQRSSKENFYEKLTLLEKDMIEADPKNAGGIKEKCAVFRKFEMRHIQLELAYNAAYEAAEDALNELENVLFLIEKNAFTDASSTLESISEVALRAKNPYVVTGEQAAALEKQAASLQKNLRAQAKRGDFSELTAKLQAMREILSQAVALEKPNFFALGYYQYATKEPAPAGTVAEQNAFYRRYLDEHFMLDFIAAAEKGLDMAEKKYLALRQEAVRQMEKALPVFSATPLEDQQLQSLAAELNKAVTASINPIDVVKDSAAYTFGQSLKAFVDTYFQGKRTNGGKLRKYERQRRRYEMACARGKTPDWKLAAPTVIDLELAQQNMVEHIQHMLEHYGRKNAQADQVNLNEKAVALIDYLKENASGMVLKVTKRGAKRKALKLMEEVGIPEPRKRYRSYPFEFSGGMRQRIVIAIALAANPDILICDEPTTALDVRVQAQILELINRLKEKRNLSIIFITHDLGVVANMADRIAVMYAGKIVEYGTAEEIFYSPAHPYTWALLSSMPDLDTKEKLEAIPGTPPNMIYPPKGDAFAERNRYAMKIDFERQPPAFPISPTHWAATWLLHPNAPKVDPPKAVTERIAKMRARMEGEANA